MPYDFSYNPGVQDVSGQLFAQGLAQAGDAIAKGITDYREKQKQKAQADAAVNWLKRNGQAFGLDVDPTDDGELQAAVKAAGGGSQAIQMISALTTAKQSRDLQAAQVAAANAQAQDRMLRITQDQRNVDAARQAASPIAPDPTAGQPADPNAPPPAPRDPTGEEMIRRYLQAGGEPNAGTAHMLMAAAKPQAQPQLQTIVLQDENGKPVTFAWDGRSAPQRITTKDAKDVTQTMLIGGKQYTVGPGNKYFDEKGAPVEFGAEKPMTATDWIISGQKPEDYKKYRDAFASATAPAPAPAPSSAAPAGTGAAGAAPPVVKTKADRDALPPGTPYVGPDGKMYVKAK